MSMWSGKKKCGNCNDLKTFLCLWALSTHFNRNFLGKLYLYLTTPYKELLIDYLKIKADYVSTELDYLLVPKMNSCEHWSAGKLYACASQTRPFIHIDYDAWLLDKLPNEIKNKEVIVQNKEIISEFSTSYPIRYFKENIPHFPPIYYKYLNSKNDFAFNVGFVGGNNVKFITNYSQIGLDVLISERNTMSLNKIYNWLPKEHHYIAPLGLCLIIEQYGLSSMVREENIDVGIMQDNSLAKYKHLWGTIKKENKTKKEIMILASKYVPDIFKRINSIIQSKEIQKYFNPSNPQKLKIGDKRCLIIDITYKCNRACINCNRLCNIFPRDSFMTISDIQNFIKESEEGNNPWKCIAISGGEPTSHPEFYTIVNLIVDYCRKHNIELYLNTSDNKSIDIPKYVIVRRNTITYNKRLHYPSTIAPIDMGIFNAFNNSCDESIKCGICLNHNGYYACSPGAAIDDVLHLGKSVRLLSEITKDNLREKCYSLCRYCGTYTHKQACTKMCQRDKQEISPAWMNVTKTRNIVLPQYTESH